MEPGGMAEVPIHRVIGILRNPQRRVLISSPRGTEPHSALQLLPSARLTGCPSGDAPAADEDRHNHRDGDLNSWPALLKSSRRYAQHYAMDKQVFNRQF